MSAFRLSTPLDTRHPPPPPHLSLHLKIPLEAAEMAERLRGLAVLPEDLGANPSTHMTAYNHP